MRGWQVDSKKDSTNLNTYTPTHLPTATYAWLYDEGTMPEELRAAHKMNDMAVALAYGFESILEDEAAIVAELMKLYKRLTS